MNIKYALEVERIKPKKNGLLLCVDEKNKKYVSITLEEIPLKVNNVNTTLGAFLQNLSKKYDRLVDILMED